MTEPFAPQTTVTEPTQPDPDNTPFVDPTDGGTDEGKSLEDQIKGMEQRLKDKDTFIDTLKNETKEMRDTIETFEQRMNNLEEIKKALKNNEQGTSNQPTEIDENALVGKVIESLSERESKKAQEENYNTVMEQLTESYGAQNVYSKVKTVADSNGLTLDYMGKIAKQSPTAFFNLMGKAPAQSPQPTHGTVTPPKENNDSGLEYYSKLRRENPIEFQKPEVQRAYRLAILNNKGAS